MATSLHRFDRILPAYRTRYGPEVDALALAIGLLVGLVGIVPTFTLAVRHFDAPIPLPSLVAAVGVLVFYSAAVLGFRRVRVGTVVALVVLGTFAADLPLSNVTYPGALGPRIWLFELPLVAGFVLAVHDGWHHDLIARLRGEYTNIPLSHILFGAFVLWSVLVGLFGAGPSLAAGLFFALHMVTAFAVFVLVAGAMTRGWLQFRTVLSVLVAAAIAHMAFAVSQLVHGRNFGLSYLGEVAENTPLVEILGMTFHAGPYISGLTGGSSPFTVLVLLSTPVLTLHVICGESRKWARIASGILAVGSLALMRVTLKDAARGAAFVIMAGIVIAAVTMAVSARRRGDGRSRWWRAQIRDSYQTVIGAFGTVTLGLATLIVQVRILTGPGARTSSSGGFNLASVGFRKTQYLAALDASFTHPLFGLGGANFAYVVKRYGMEPATGPGIEIGNAVHNAYLSVLSGTGVPGFLLFCGLLLSVLWAAVELVRDSREERWLAYAALIGVVGYGALIFWNVMLVTIVGTITFFAFAGAIVGAASKRNGKQSHSHTSTYAVAGRRS